MKIEVKICMGTACYVMGGSELATLSEYLTPEQLKYVDIKGEPCINACFDQKEQRPPFVHVGEVLISEANINKVKEEIERQITELSL
ncbi:MAG: hypothetical protein IKY22_10615 [Bacteroidales bacterium]|nr:hypothetical protein [Bacteroidales bacterium]